MARLVAVCRDGEEDFPFLARQIPLYIDDTLTMVMEFTDSVMNLDTHQINSSQMKQFVEHHSMLKQQDLNIAMMVTSREVFSALAQLVPCVGCRRSVERLFSQLVESGNPALEPLTVKPTGVLSVTKACMADAKMLYTLFYVHGSKLNDTINAIPKSKKNKRCQLHSLDTHKPKPLGGEGSVDKMLGLENNKDGGAKTDSRCSVVFPFGRCPAPSRGSWMDVWELMSQECRDEVVLIDSACLLETLETYLRKHRFCTDCKNKVLRAYNILVGELDCTKEKGYCAALYEGLRCCPHERHVHVCCETDFMAHLLGRAEPEFSGGYERRERHAKTIDIAQEEVLTCLGIHLYERLHRIWQKLRAEEQTWQMLFYLGIDALRKSFETAVEKVQGISRLEQLCEELSEEERAKELKQEKKRQKKKNRRKNKCSFDVSVQEAEGKDKSLDEGSLESVESGGGCKACGSREGEGGHVGCVEVVVTSNESPTSCSCPDGNVPILGSPKVKKGLSPHSNGSDYGYSSSMEGSEPGSQEGSDVACAEGICNHDEAGDYLCGHHCAEDKEDGGVDSCVECWANSKENTKKKKKTRKNKGLLSYHQGPNAEGCVVEENRRAQNTAATSPVCRTKETCAQLCLDTCSSIALPWGEHRKNMSYCLEANICGQEDTNAKSLMELLDDSEVTSDDENCLTQDEIQSFVDNNKSFYNNRDQYRQHLKDKFTKYCRGGGDWFAAAAATTSVN
ncbi:gametogenetin-binding protein 2 isoform X2 [Coregonus clupeaformis]|uniref:gametogenetin-binding protein 2 isoform X2 n=1 Tax=Coregonus clupeaformis TaxID=59861 RepID=UPI001BE0C982|nr:gametogenetin-binding protein 2 isoform X2 [Coregonus clupeaformis]